MAKKGGKPPSAAQLANRKRFAALARSNRGAVGFGGGGSFSRGGVHKMGSQLKAAFHRISWGVAGLSAVAGYFIPSTLSNLGIGELLYSYVPGWSTANDALWSAVNDMGIPADSNPWGNGGLVGLGKTAGAGYAAKTIYDFQKTGRIGQGALNVGLPFALGLILDGPELNPMAGPAAQSPSGWVGGGTPVASNMNAQGGVAW